MAASYFSSLPKFVPDEVFNLLAAFREDKHPDRVNLGAGVYATEEGQSWPLSVVNKVERHLQDEDNPSRHDYLPIAGDQSFLKLARDLAFSFDINQCPEKHQLNELRIASVQTVAGTGANHICARFLANELRPQHVWLSNPTWANHHMIWETVGISEKQYPYYNATNCTFDFAGMMQMLEEQAKPRDILVLHACAHNPTGLDPTKEQWVAIAALCQRKQLFPFFDMAYQGFASGDPVQDAWAIRYFFELQPRLEMAVAQSFSKNFGLYGQRTGALHLVLGDSSVEIKEDAVSNLCHLLRSEVSMAPKYGSTIVKTILESKDLKENWMADLQVMSTRIRSMRMALYDELIRLGTPGSWRHIVDQVSSRMMHLIRELILTLHLDRHVLIYRTHTFRGSEAKEDFPHLHAFFRTHIDCRL
jgi:aspartate aminotransferase